jgi:N6-adenosine-specific RNA methylase IME4
MQITWVKKTASGNIAISQGYYFLHSSEICLVGVKYDAKGKSLEFISKVRS